MAPPRKSATIQPPKDLDKFGPCADVADQLTAIAALVRSRRGKAKFSLQLRFWNNEWIDPALPKPEFIVTGTELHNKEQKG